MKHVRVRIPMGVLALLFVVIPLAELYIVVQSSQLIGLGWTILLLIADSLLGAFLLKHQGAAAWKALNFALKSGKLPARELADGALILVGGTLLLTPGFISDAAGFLFILPFTRPVARRALTAFLTRKFLAEPGPGPGSNRTQQRPGPDAVVQGEVVD